MEKTLETPVNGKKTGKKTHKVRKVLLWILGVILGLIALIFIANAFSTAIDLNKAKSFEPVKYENQLTPVMDNETGFYTFTTDREFKVMHLSDIHIGSGFLSVRNDFHAMEQVARMIQVEKPDLVIVTGDAVFPVPRSMNLNNADTTKVFVNFMNHLGVYWCYAYGNHDQEMYSFHTEEYTSKLYEGSSKYCLFQRGPEDVSGEGNYAVNVKNSDGVITRSYIMLDSHSYKDSDKWGTKWEYANIEQNQIDWYKDTVNSLSAKNQKTIKAMDNSEKVTNYTDEFKTVKSFLFFHIPLEEYKTAWNNYMNNGYKDTADTKYVFGEIGEPEPYVYCGADHDNLFETAKELGSTQGMFCGHDHYNNTSFVYQGIQLTYAYSIDNLAYSNIINYGSQRGCTLVYSEPNGKYNITHENYYQDKYDYEGRESVTMQHLNEAQEKAQGTYGK